MKVRIIHVAGGGEESEALFFTKNFRSQAHDLVGDDGQIYSDSERECDLPVGFPMDAMLYNWIGYLTYLSELHHKK